MRLNPTTQLTDGRLLLAWWANNKGRGSSNCTLMVVPPNTPRAAHSRDQTNVETSTLTSSWRNNVNLSRRVQDTLGIAGVLPK
jgi:hypothetical protein